ncbi:unnamed protein product [Gadus morhua 'NCC']
MPSGASFCCKRWKEVQTQTLDSNMAGGDKTTVVTFWNGAKELKGGGKDPRNSPRPTMGLLGRGGDATAWLRQHRLTTRLCNASDQSEGGEGMLHQRELTLGVLVFY